MYSIKIFREDEPPCSMGLASSISRADHYELPADEKSGIFWGELSESERERLIDESYDEGRDIRIIIRGMMLGGT